MKERPYPVEPGWWTLLDDYMAQAYAVAPDMVHDENEKYGRCDLCFETEMENVGDALLRIADAVEEQSQLRYTSADLL